MRVLVAIEAADFRRGIDGLAQLCRGTLSLDPFSGMVFVFRNRRATAVKIRVLPASVREIAVAPEVGCHPKWRMAHATKRQIRDPGGDGEGQARYRGMAVDAHEALSAA
jgi:hypothetical protein